MPSHLSSLLRSPMPSHLSIVAQDDFSLFGSSMLFSLNISHNHIETFPSFALYPSRRLRVFDARHNAPDFKVSYAGLGPAMRFCRDDVRSVVLLDNPSHCGTGVSQVGGIASCYYVICKGNIYGFPALPCDDGATRSMPYYLHCDGVNNGCGDEAACQPLPAIRSSNQNPDCQAVADCFPDRASLHFDGDLVYFTTPLGAESNPSCPMHVNVSTRLFFTRNALPWTQEIGDGPRRLTIEVEMQMNRSLQSVAVVVQTMYHPAFFLNPVRCGITYEIKDALLSGLLGFLPDDEVTFETPVMTTVASEPGSAHHTSKAPLISTIAGGLAALFLCLCLGLALTLRRTRRTRLHMRRLDSLAPLVPQHLLEAVRLPRGGRDVTPSCHDAYPLSHTFYSTPPFLGSRTVYHAVCRCLWGPRPTAAELARCL